MRRPGELYAGGVLLLLLLLVAAAPAHAQTAPAQQPVLVEPLTALKVEATRDAPVEFTFSLFNLNSRTSFFVTASGSGLDGWRLSATPDRFFLEPRGTANVTVLLTADGRPPENTEGVVRLSLVSSETGSVHVSEHRVQVRVTDAALVLGVFDNPLPPPFDNAYGVFALDIAFWAVFGVASFVAGDAVVRVLTQRASAHVTSAIAQRLRWPVFSFVLLLGLKQSIDVLPRNPVTVFAARFLAATAVGIVGIYLLYRVVDGVLYYYAAHIAPRTASRVDDILVPALRKVAVVVLSVVAIGYTLSVFGINPNVLFGAAGIMGLVIAFAAQDTLSNFFSGIFLILDRPFAEGDYIQIETGEICRVERIGLRSTRLYNYRTHELIVLPNNQLASRRIVNLAVPDTRYRITIEFGVSYDTDVDRMRALVERTVLETPGVDPSVPLSFRFRSFGDSALVFAVRATVESFLTRDAVATEIRMRLLKSFRANGIEIPFPQRVLHVAPPPAGGPGGVSIRLEPPERGEGRNR